jgi:cytochrome c peroxidase
VIAGSRRRGAAFGALLLAAVLVYSGVRDGRAGSSVAVASVEAPNDVAAASLGKRLFFDPSLSASGRISCATCHSPAHAYGPPNGRAVQLGGVKVNRPGLRAVPTLRYTLNRTPIWFHEQSVSLGERLVENEPPAGGFTADGRFNRLRDQATAPLLDPSEMANANSQAVVAKLRAAPYAADFRTLFGPGIFGDAQAAYAGALYAIERFELTDASFHPFTSKYDAYLDGDASLTPQERHGKLLFDDPQRAGCEICHLDEKGANGAHPVFTDYQFEALGVPRNMEIPANHDPRYYDMGLCGPMRSDESTVASYCGSFKTPTLRNVATRHAFFHNGRFHTLRDALRFYVQRDTDPQKWYPVGRDGTVEKYDDLPERYRANVDTTDAPLKSKHGERPIWSESDISDVIAFLHTLDDGYSKRSHDGGVSPVTSRRY